MPGFLLDANVRWVLAGSMLLGLTAGVLGSFALLRRRSLMGDALAHAALPGVAIAYMISGSKQIGLLMIGAAAAGLLGTMAISAITRYSKIKEDSAMGIVLSVFFGVGIVLLTVIQRSPRGNQSGLDKFLFGQAASLIGADVIVMVAIAAVLCLVTLALFKEFKLLSFDAGFGAGLGLPMGLLDAILNLMIVLAVVVGLQAVGVVLMAALLITPAIAARYWTERLSLMVLLAGLFGALSGALGTLLSLLGPRMSTGPLIVLAATAIFVVSLLAAPRRGLLARLYRLLRLRRQVARENALRALYELAEEAGAAGASFTVDELRRRRGLADRNLTRVLERLAGEGLVHRPANGGAAALDRWALAEAGVTAAFGLVRRQRLWEVYLMHEAELGGATADPDETSLPDGLEDELERLLRIHGLQPRLAPATGGV